jgi:hypothetical protein
VTMTLGLLDVHVIYSIQLMCYGPVRVRTRPSPHARPPAATMRHQPLALSPFNSISKPFDAVHASAGRVRGRAPPKTLDSGFPGAPEQRLA